MSLMVQPGALVGKRSIRLLLALIVVAAYMSVYIAQADIGASICGDMVGKLLQVEDLLSKGMGDFSCRYRESFDPEFRFLPGPEYFYWVSDGACRYMYTYAYAYAVAPFYVAFVDSGHVIMNVLCLVGIVLASFWLGALIFPEFRFGDLAFGLASFLVIPSGIYLLDFGEMGLSLAMWAFALALSASALWSGSSLRRQNLALFLAAFLAGILFAFRSESLIIAIFLLLAIALDRAIAFRRGSSGERFTWTEWIVLLVRSGAPSAMGYAVGLGAVIAFHQILFGNPLGLRGAYHVELASSGFSASTQLHYFGQLLFGGNVGLFTSLPFTLLALVAFVPFIWRQISRRALFFAIIAIPATVLIAATTPVDGGAQWSPRYLALTTPAYAALAGLVIYAARDRLTRPLISLPLALLLLYSLVFAHIGMKIAIQAGRQTAQYAAALDRLAATRIVVRNPAVYSVLGRRHYHKPAYQCIEDQECAVLLQKRELQARPGGLILVSLDSQATWTPPAPWRTNRREAVAGLVFAELLTDPPARGVSDKP